MKELILATSNKGKIKELRALLSPIHCIPQSDLNIPEALETGLSFIENALIKARHASAFAKKPALADDSGLVVPALNGEPGIFSARFAGVSATDADNMALLLNKMAHLPKAQRQAYFYCAIAVVRNENDPAPLVATGRLEGSISCNLQGAKGFGYDPLFYIEEYQCVAAELDMSVKNTISHRARALQHLRTLLFSLS